VQGKNGEQVNSAMADIKVYLDGDGTPEGMVPLLTARSSTKRTSGFTSSVRPLQPAVCGPASICRVQRRTRQGAEQIKRKVDNLMHPEGSYQRRGPDRFWGEHKHRIRHSGRGRVLGSVGSHAGTCSQSFSQDETDLAPSNFLRTAPTMPATPVTNRIRTVGSGT